MRNKTGLLFAIAVGSITLVLGLFWVSKDTMALNNPFIRQFPPHAVEPDTFHDLGLDSYYIAGSDANCIYLGNYTVRLRLWAFEKEKKAISEIKLTFRDTSGQVGRPVFHIDHDRYELLDGQTGSSYTGSTGQWVAEKSPVALPYFTVGVPMGNDRVLIRTSDAGDMSNLIGLVDRRTGKSTFFPSLLTRQSKGDGIFDTDGSMLFNDSRKQIVYVYAYRNEFFTAGSEGNILSRGHTIDTVTRAQVSIAHNKGQATIDVPPLLVNAKAATTGNLLFVEGRLRGKYDDKEAWQKASTIDVYDLRDNQYLLSFYVAGYGGKKMSGFFVDESHLYAIVDRHLVAYKFNSPLLENL